MIWVHAIWLTIGLILGVLHALGIRQSTKHPSVLTALIGLARIVVVGLILAVAAIYGGILPAAAGWAVGLFAGIGVVMRTRPRISQRRSTP